MTELITALPTDFNSVDEHGYVATLHELGRVFWYEPAPGVLVSLYDGDGDSCLGVVQEVHDDLILVRPHWASWQAPSRALLTGSVGVLVNGSQLGQPSERPATLTPTPTMSARPVTA